MHYCDAVARLEAFNGTTMDRVLPIQLLIGQLNEHELRRLSDWFAAIRPQPLLPSYYDPSVRGKSYSLSENKQYPVAMTYDTADSLNKRKES